MAHPDEKAEQEAAALARQFQMPRPKEGHSRVHSVDTYGRQRKRNLKKSLEEAFQGRPQGLNEHFTSAMMVYLNESSRPARELRR